MADTPAQNQAPRLPRRRMTWPWASRPVDVESQDGPSETADNELEAPVRHDSYPSILKQDYILKEDYTAGPRGWSYVARSQDAVANGPLHRRQDELRQRVLHYKEARLAQIEKLLKAIDTEEDGNDESELRSLSPWQMGIKVDGVKLLSPRDELMHEADEMLKSYDETLLRDIELRKHELVQRKVVQNLNNSLASAGVLDKCAMHHFLHADDFITTRDENKYIHNPLESLVYLDGGPIHDFVMKPFVDKREYAGAAGAAALSIHYRSDRLKMVFMTMAITLLLSALLAPVAILYFAEPGKSVSLSVVLLFGIAATVMMATIPGIKLDTIFIAMSAYMAVMVTFLANFQGSNLS